MLVLRLRRRRLDQQFSNIQTTTKVKRTRDVGCHVDHDTHPIVTLLWYLKLTYDAERVPPLHEMVTIPTCASSLDIPRLMYILIIVSISP